MCFLHASFTEILLKLEHLSLNSFCFLQVLIDHFLTVSLVQSMSLNLEKLILPNVSV